MFGTKYIVKAGDTLWDISSSKLGDPLKWPAIVELTNKEFNNPHLRQVYKPSHFIKNPDLIFVGQTLLIPKTARSRPQIDPTKGKKKACIACQAPTLSFDLSGPELTKTSGNVKVTMRFAGKLALKSEKSISPAEINKNGGVQTKLENKYKSAYGELTQSFDASFDPKSKRISFSTGLTSSATNLPNSPSTSAKLSVSPLGNPVATATFSFPKLEGKHNGMQFTALDYQVDIEIEKLSDRSRTASQPVVVPTSVQSSSPENELDLWLVAGGSIVILGGAAVIIGTLVEDVLTAGAGVADDAPSFALAAGMFARGWAMINNARLPVAVASTGAASTAFAEEK
ncbi:LysM peptidoglycan-binding domain-containing protein [Litoribacillus peritrichatus]|uniref:LysM domain-containing protein n=1 Tax=Litoribacillus peritrichatus TaxID=718191 RepID=A0ABP7N4C9_9GAMM